MSNETERSYYKFECKQTVSTTVSRHSLTVGRIGRVYARRGIEGVPQYLVKFEGKAHPCHFEEHELLPA